VLYFVTRFLFPHNCPYKVSRHKGKGYNTRESLRASSLAINLAFKWLCGGHGQTGMNELDKHGIRYKVEKTYPNGVRVGYVLDHANKVKRQSMGQSWFPKSWTSKDIKHAGEHVANLKSNRHVPDGKRIYGMWKGVRVGVIKTNGKNGTIFPDSKQPVKKGGKK
jgi:hypothetical protein